MARVTNAVVELQGLTSRDEPSAWISNLWVNYRNQMQKKYNEWREVDEYVFAVDTSTTSNSSLPWTHNCHVPKITQIRDNLHSNYISSLFPNDKWLQWMAYSRESAKKEVAKVMTSYMENKTREGGFRETISHLLYDYIDRGNAFAQPTFEVRYKTTATEKVTDFIGPRLCRIAPENIVFDPTAVDFKHTHKIVRSIIGLGELQELAEGYGEDSAWSAAFLRRKKLHDAAVGFSVDDWSKAAQYTIDGFGSLQEYYGSNTVELLEFYGDYYDAHTGELKSRRMITIVDRSVVVRDIPIPSYSGHDAIEHVGWRLRSNNLWAMGPLDNLVGMQYQLDHYYNMSANALDLKVMPPKIIKGDVEAFEWAPNAEIHVDDDGDVSELGQNFGDIAFCLQYIEQIEMRMELYAGAPREAAGIRTPGEKTAFEVQSLENAAGRIFQEKIIQFELFMEKCLNNMLEEAHRNMDMLDTIRVIDDDLGVQQFIQITKEDITANGILRPVGARHYAQKAQELQNLIGIFNSPMINFLQPHTSGLGMIPFVNDVIDLRGYEIFKPNAQLAEQQELQALSNQAEEDNIMNSQQSPEELLVQNGFNL